MARQRFIWPSIWDDPDMGKLNDSARLLYIGCFSLADDDGRIIGDPVYLKTQIFRYSEITTEQVRQLRDELTIINKSLTLYVVAGIDYLAFLNWSEFQKPKYPTASKLPSPPGRKRSQTLRTPQKSSGKTSPNDSGKTSGNDSPAIPGTIPPQGWAGLGRSLEAGSSFTVDPDRDPSTNANGLPFSHELLVTQLLAHIGNDADEGTPKAVRRHATHLTEAALARVLESVRSHPARNGRAAQVVGALKSEAGLVQSPTETTT